MKQDKSLQLDALIAWLETKPSGQHYFYQACDRCLLAQYFRDIYGRCTVQVGSGEYVVHYRFLTYRYPLPPEFNSISIGDGQYSDWTFGKALQRAMAIRASRS